MTEAKKTVSVKPAAKAVAAKAADTKTSEVKAAEAVPAEAAETKKAAKKPAAKRAGRKPAEKKETAKKTTKKEAVKEVVHVQFGGKEYSTEDLVKIAKDVWKYDLKQKSSDFKSVELYVKPEDNVVYYVINGDVTGSFAI